MKNKNKLCSLASVSTAIILFLIIVSSTSSAATSQSVLPTKIYAYVPANNISIIDTATDTVIDSACKVDGGFGVAVNPAGTKVYITNNGGSTVSVFDTATNNVTAIVPVGNTPYGVAVTPDGKKAYIANFNSNTVSVIDTATNTVKSTVPVGSYPMGIAVSPDGTKVYVVNELSDSISVIDTASDTVTDAIPAGNQHFGVAFTPDGTKAYVTTYAGSNSVSVIYTATKAIATVPVGAGSRGVAVSPDGKKVYVTNTDSNTVSIIDTATNTVPITVSVGSAPRGVSVTPDGQKVYVANSGSNTVSVINTATYAVTTLLVGNNPVAFGQFIPSVPVQPVLPVANFTSNVTSGYAPLDVQFTDLSKNATHLEWNFGDGSSNTSVANPEHVFTSPGQFNVLLTASNANGSSSKSMTINVTPNPVTLSFNPQTVGLQPGSSQDVQIVMNKIPASGLSGYNVTVSVLDPAIANITAVSPPGWAGVSSTSTVPSGSVWITAVDTIGQVHPDDINVSLGNITLTGGKNGTTKLIIVPTEIDDNNGDLMNPNVTNGTINVNQLVPFPGCINPPTDPNHDGLYEDINGNGRWDFADVVKYFNNMGWIPQNEPVTYFDFNHNGRIDFNDVVKLFNMQSS